MVTIAGLIATVAFGVCARCARIAAMSVAAAGVVKLAVALATPEPASAEAVWRVALPPALAAQPGAAPRH